MSAPVFTDYKVYAGTSGIPNNDSSPYGGAIDLSAALNPNTSGNLFSGIKIIGSNVDYYSVMYGRVENASPGTFQNARWANRAGARVNTTSGAASLVSTNINDLNQVKVIGKISGAWDFEVITLTGNVVITGNKIWDTGSVIRWESLTGVPVGNITCSVNSYVCGIIWGTLDDVNATTYMASAEVQLAVASAKNTAVSGTNRLTAPVSGISAFSNAVKWNTNDQSINVPTGVINPNDYSGLVIKLTSFANVPPPVPGELQIKPNLVGESVG